MPSVLEIIRRTYSGVPSLLKEIHTSVKAMSMVVLLAFLNNGVASSFWVVYVTGIIGLTKVEWGWILFYESILRLVLTLPAGDLEE